MIDEKYVRTNQALAKAAEELSGGLAADTPLEATGRSRAHVGSAKRIDAFEIVLRALESAEEYHAALGIGLGWLRRNNPAKLKSSYRMWGGVYGTGLQDSEAATQDIMGKFNKWWDHMTIRRLIDKRQCAIGICAEGRTFQEIGWAHSLHRDTVKSYALQGIREFERVNRVEKPVIHSVPKSPENPDRFDAIFKVTRVIIFAD